MRTVFNTNIFDHLNQPMFFGEPVSIARYDVVKYPQFEKLTEKQLSVFWRPEEVELYLDQKDFKSLPPQAQHIFTSNLKRQIVLDSEQGRAPSIAFLPICSLPELEVWIQTWAFFETIHSRSYTHIIRNVYSNPSEVFDRILDIPEIVECAKDISRYYDNLINFKPGVFSEYDHKKALWFALNAVNALEGIRFYVSFACSWAFAEVKKMEGNAKIIKLIARDENLHLASTQQMLKLLPKEDPDFTSIKDECEQQISAMFMSVINQEKAWAKYLFKDGSIIGLNEKLLCDYVEFRAAKIMKASGLPIYDLAKDIKTNPLPWTEKWISGKEIQVAPQETQITAYLNGGINKNVDKDTFKGFKL